MGNKSTAQIGIENRRKILNFIIHYITDNGYSPTIREIGDGVGLTSTSSILHHLWSLERDGKIKMKSGQPRTISVVGYEFKKCES